MNDDLFSDGQVVATGNNTYTGQFRGLLAVANTTVSAMTWEVDYAATGNWTSLTLIPPGTLLRGRFTSITMNGQALLDKV
jgi:hypothetical protein